MSSNPRFLIKTFGCRCNQADGCAIRDSLCRSEYEETQDVLDADLVVVNTCTVTHRSDQEARQTIRRIHRGNPRARIVVSGCYAERDPEALSRLPGVSLVVGNAGKDRIPETIESVLGQSGTRIVRSTPGFAPDHAPPAAHRARGKTRPLLKVQDGCDARCSYCIVPSVRGSARSVSPCQLLPRIGSLVEQGYQEIVLTGINLGMYGRKLRPRTTLVELLARVVAMPGIGRVRLSSIEPMRFSRDIVRLAVESPVLARHFHIPLQSGSDRILRRMRRPYTASRFLALLEHIANALPEVGLGTDVLVGFPGETDHDFEETCKVVRDSPLGYLHVFPFSAREGTDAWLMKDQVPAGVVRERARALREMSQSRNLSFRGRFLGRDLDGITLAKEEERGDSVVLTGNYIHCRADGPPVPPNRLVRIRLERADSAGTSGTLVGCQAAAGAGLH